MAEQTLNDRDPEEAAAAEADPQGAAAALDELRREKDALQDRLLRTAAEFDNYRKRIDKERREISEYAASEIVLELLPVIDNLERALQAPSPVDADPIRRGVELIHRQLLDLLRKRGVKHIDSLGATFDPNFHQAVAHEVSDTHEEGEVMEELQRGYMIGDRLLRPSMVKVAKRS